MKEKTAQTSSSPTMKKRQKIDSTKSSESSDKSKVPFTSCNDSPSSREVKNSICRYLIENGQDFSVAASPSFKKMMNLCSGKADCAIPTVEQLKGSIFDSVVKEMDVYVSDIKSSWADTGCSVLLDEWIDPKGRSLMNVLVDCPKGAIYLNSYDASDISGDIDAIQNFFEVVLMEIGISNVVQVVTNSTSLITDEIRMQLTDKFRSVFWTRSASSCIGLMVEEMSADDRIKDTLDKANIITGFVYSRPNVMEHLRHHRNGRDFVKRIRNKSFIPFCILENVLENCIWILYSSAGSLFTFGERGRKVNRLLSDSSFQRDALIAVETAMPLIRVIDWMDENDKAHMGYIYEKIDQANRRIPVRYRDIIENVWKEQFLKPLHSAGYVLNPNIFYSRYFELDPEVTMGLLRCVVRSTEDVRVQDKLVLQLEQYLISKSRNSAFSEASSIPPVEWWSEYGKDCPDLQRLAIRILSQKCDGASRFRLDRKLAETLLTTEEKGRNPSEQDKLREMTYLRYNLMLQNYESGEDSNAVTSEEDDTLYC